jgi:hypothetical protein
MSKDTAKKTPGLIIFAAIMMFGLGGLALLSAVAGFMGSSWLQEYSVFGDKLGSSAYGFIDLILTLTAFYTGLAILRGTRGGYWLGILFATLNMLRWFVLMPGAPLWSVTMVAIWVLVAYGLATNEDHFQEGATSWAGEQMVAEEELQDQWH